MNVDVITKCVHVATKDKRGVHEAARIDEFAFLSDLHLLHVKHEDTAEDLECDGTLSTKDQDFIVSHLIG